jgi:hypothetical protein
LDRANSTYTHLLECVSLNGVREHQAAFQRIADNSSEPVYPGTRAAGTVGYDDSVDYVAGLLRDAGYEVTLDPVEITFNFPPVLEQLTPNPEPYETGVFSGSGEGDVSAAITAVDINLMPPRDPVRVVATEPSRSRPLARRSWRTPMVPTTSPASQPATSH